MLLCFPESDSNSESDTEGSEDDEEKDQEDSDSDTEGEKTATSLNQTTSSANSTPISLTAHSAPHNLHIGSAPGSAPAALCSESPSPAFLGTSSTLTASPHSGTTLYFYPCTVKADCSRDCCLHSFGERSSFDHLLL